MGHLSRSFGSYTFVLLAAAGMGVPPAAAQSPLKEIGRKLEEARRKIEERTRAAGDASRDGASAAPAVPAAGASRSSAKVEEQVLVTGEPGLRYFISPRNQHLAAVVNRGSRVAVVHDGVEGPRFDEVLSGQATDANLDVAFSPDGSRLAYVARSDQEYVVMLDGKELARGGPWAQSTGKPTVIDHDFTPGGTHHYFITQKEIPGRQQFQLHFDGRPGPISTSWFAPVFSADGSRHAYLIEVWPTPSRSEWVLVVDGKLAAYRAGQPQFSADGRSLYTQRQLPGGAGTEVLLDGRPLLRSPAQGSIALRMAPAGSLVVGVVTAPPQPGRPRTFLTVGAVRVPGSECDAVLEVFFSADGRHYAARCPSNSGAWVIADGRKGRGYQGIASDVEFTADGRPVYQALSNGKTFVIVGDLESDGHHTVGNDLVVPGGVPPATIAGDRVGFVGMPTAASGSERMVVVDGKATRAVAAGELRFSPDGSRYAYLAGHPVRRLFVDGTEQRGLVPAASSHPTATVNGRMYQAATYTFSPDGRHVAYFAYPESDNRSFGVAIDGRFLRVADVNRIANITFTPDGKHVAWLARRGDAPRHVVYVDGEIALEVPSSMELEQPGGVHWAMGADGVLALIAQTGESIKRFRITPGAGTGVESLLARARAPR